MEFAGIDVKPNNSVNNVRISPMQAIKPRISRAGLIGRLSATIGLGIDRPLLTQTCRPAQAFNSRNDAFPAVKPDSTPKTFGGCPLTSCLCARKLKHEYKQRRLVSIP